MDQLRLVVVRWITSPHVAVRLVKPEVKGKSFGETVARLIVPPVQGDDYDLGWLVERTRRDFLRGWIETNDAALLQGLAAHSSDAPP